MKQLNLSAFLRWSNLVVVAAISATVLSISSCKDDNEDPAPSPIITLSSSSAQNIPGATVSTTVTVDAPAGGKTLNILVNGAQSTTLPNVELNGEKSKATDVSFTIPQDAVIGSTVVITFTAVDNANQNSAPATFTIDVSSVPAKQIVDVEGTISTNTTWTKDKIYRLKGFVRVGTDTKLNGATTPTIGTTATLTIQAGTVIMGSHETTPKGALIIQRGSKIIAEGTASEPIVFTSDKAAGSRQAGDWAGLVICGQAANNIKGSTGTDGIAELEGNYGAFHGGSPAVDNDNSGILKYVRIEYAGYAVNPNQELNGLTLGSVGSGTTVDYVQVSYGQDDSFEWFGGSVNAKHLIAYRGADDDFDVDNGFSGNVQYGLGIRDAATADQSGSNGFEVDNDGNGSGNTPFTSGTFSNFTIVGPKATSSTTVNIQFWSGAHLRRNNKLKLINTFITGYPVGIFIDNNQGSAIANAVNGDLVLKNNILSGVQGWGGNGFGSAATADEQAALSVGAGSNHPNAPRGLIFASGAGKDGSGNPSNTPFINGVFSYTAAQINGTNGLPWFLANTNNAVYAKWNDVGLSSTVFDALSATPTLLPTAGSPLLNGGSTSGFTGLEDVSFRGAFGPQDWTTGWANWNPNTTDYSK